jgi:uncharacterized membrane protein
MDRYEFINQMRAALAGNVSQNTIEESIGFYNDYIDMHLKNGELIETILEELGNPRLLAKTIIETSKTEDTTSRTRTTESGGNKEYQQETGSEKILKVLNLPKWLLIIMGIIVVMIIIGILLSLISLVIYLFVPILIICGVIWGIKYLIRLFKS